ncbi:hypothetical protein OCH239_12975 [Roseivivax halodurans JCM 10272]|uniref:Glycosyltransferase subfamily 4-like N-terminal domain-containing protein n=1 Tax=Roseivivax halodurans JCM 10272 TaxID=1449350 RepID=X7EB42_9RHOB|nr:glycosyltransferase family 4 protein [Roseivivax halodurans]ETX13177.1 hypothetical protein OCH239_12975 [Roseivivax halodurans JCM 10272]
MQRRLDDADSGSAVYLLGLVDRLMTAGFAVNIVVSPAAGFGSIPVSRPACAIAQRACRIVWPGSLRIGSVYISLRWRPWQRAALRSLAHLVWVICGRTHLARPAMPSLIGYTPTDKDTAKMVDAANALGSTIAVSEYSALAPVLARVEAPVRAVLLHDLFALRAESFRKLGLAPDHRDVSLERELDWLGPADLLLFASLSDQRALAPCLPEKRHIWLPPRVVPKKVAADGPLRAVFLGVRHGGNIDALDLLLTQVWPSVHNRLPDAELWIVGEIGASVQGRHAGVKVLGRVDDLTTIGGSRAVGLAPNRAVSGVSIKIATYLELGMPVLAMRTAVEGYGHRLDEAVVLAEDEGEFTDRLMDLLSDSCQREEAALQSVAAARAKTLAAPEFELFCADLIAKTRPDG